MKKITIMLLAAGFLFSCKKKKDDIPAPVNFTVSDFAASIPENPNAGQPLGTVNAATNSGTLSFSITTQTPAGSIEINAATGELKVTDSTKFNFETNTSVTATVQVTNGGVNKTATVTLAVTDKPFGMVYTYAGTGTAGNSEGTISTASFTSPGYMVFDPSGNQYVVSGQHKIRKITPGGIVTTFAGNDVSGDVDATGTAARFNVIAQMVCDAGGNLFVADVVNHKIKKITPAGVVTTIAGSGVAGYTDGNGTAAQFNRPNSLVMDAAGNLYAGDFLNYRIRKITQAGVVTTLAGSGVAGFLNGTGAAARFRGMAGMTIDGAGNIYLGEISNWVIRKITPAGVVTTFAGAGTPGTTDGPGNTATFHSPGYLAIDQSGNIFVTDYGSHVIRKVTPAAAVTTFAGTVGSGGFINAFGTNAKFTSPGGLAFDTNGFLYVSDAGNNVIRKIAD